MVLLVLSADHRGLDLDLLRRVSAGVRGAADRLVVAGLAAGAVPLATCNRAELYLDVQDPAAAHAAARSLLADGAVAGSALRVLISRRAVAHLFSVASGLESMVVGEREIVGQVRAALAEARAAGTTTGVLAEAFGQALRVSRAIEAATGLGSAGRSLVGRALDLVEPVDWGRARCLLVGTGSYAGACLAALQSRGVRDVRVFSGSGRGRQFAVNHGVRATADLPGALAEVDVVVTCSGTGGTLLAAHLVTAARAGDDRPLVVLDLALERDVEPAVGALPGVRLVTLRDVAAATPAADGPVRAAQEMVDRAAVRFEADRRAREWDRAVVARRAEVLAGLGERQDVPPADRRRVHAALHGPTVQARAAARLGDRAAYQAALDQLSALAPGPARRTVEVS